MIEAVEFRNFKALRDVKVGLERLTVLVGPNASGKTSVLEGLNYLSLLSTKQPLSVFIGAQQPQMLYSRGGKGELEFLLRRSEGGYKLIIPETLDGHGLPTGQWHGCQTFQRQRTTEEWVQIRAALAEPAFHAALLQLDARRLAAPSVSKEVRQPQMGPQGEQLASALAYLALNQPDTFARLTNLLRMIFPYVVRLRFDRVWTGSFWEKEEVLFDLESAVGLPANQVSDGTLLALGLLTAILGTDRSELILMDDLDHGLHPRAQRDLVGVLRKLLEEFPTLQIVATTHSPYLLDHLHPEEVRLMTRKADGSAACARLDEHPEFERWKDAMAPGEFWSMIGEKWVAERELQEAVP